MADGRSIPPGKKWVLRVEYWDVFVPGMTESNERCVGGDDCGCATVPAIGAGSHPGSGGDCNHTWTYGGASSPDCIFDPTDPPDWYLQLIVDQYGGLCTGGGGIIFFNICAAYNSAVYALAHGHAAAAANPLYAGGWTIILGWWAANGAALLAKHCAGLPDGNAIPNDEGTVRKVTIQFPPGSYVVNRRCVDIDIGEECAECLSS